MPHQKDHKLVKRVSMLSAPLGWLTQLVLRFPMFVFALSVILATASVYYTQENLKFKNKRLNLINPNSEWNQYWLDYIAKFGSDDDMILAVDGQSEAEIIPVLNDLASEIEKYPDLYYSLFYKVDDSKLFAKGLHFASDEDMQGLKLFLHGNSAILENDWDSLSIDKILRGATAPLMAPAGTIPPSIKKQCVTGMQRMINSLDGVLGDEYQFISPWPEFDLASRRNVDSSDPKLRVHGDNDYESNSSSETDPTNHNTTTLRSKKTAKTPFGIAGFRNIGIRKRNLQADTGKKRIYSNSDASGIYVPSPHGSTQETSLPLGTYVAHYLNADGYQYPYPEDFSDAAYNPALGGDADSLMGTSITGETTPGTYPDEKSPTSSSDTNLLSSNFLHSENSLRSENSLHSESSLTENVTTPENTLNSDNDSGSIHYFWAVENKTGIVMFKLVEHEDESFARGTVAIDTARKIIKTVQKRHPGITIQMTGLPVLENDEMRSSSESMTLASILSLGGVTLVFMVFFGGLRHPLLAVMALLIGVGWSTGYITGFIGHLNILSISFGVILVGLGIDFGIHLTSHYLENRRAGYDIRTALIKVAREVGPGIVTGALTTAVAFAMAGLTEFTGVAELGLIAGGGIVLCCLSAICILPILILWTDRKCPVEKLPVPRDPNRILSSVQNHPMLILPAALILTVTAGFWAKDLKFDHNLMNLQPRGLESVELEMRLLEESKQSVWYALSTSKDRNELLARMDELEQKDSVARVEQIITLIPEENKQREAIISDISRQLAQLPACAKSPPILSLQEMDQCLNQIGSMLIHVPEYQSLGKQLHNLRKEFHQLTPQEYYERMQDYQTRSANDLLARMETIRSISNPIPPQLSDLPDALVERFMAKDGTYLLKIFGKGDLWDMDNLKKFVTDVRSVDPYATGNPLQTYECSLQMKRCYEEAAWLALAAVIFLLYMDLRSVRQTLLALSPVALGMLQLFGFMGIFHIPLNAANMIVLPLIIGIGIDDGIHILHDFRHQHGKSSYKISSSTAMSVILTTLTTIIGFGTLIIASHRGVQSLGIVLSLGVFFCAFTSLFVLPALLSVFCKFAEEGRELELFEAELQPISTDVPARHPSPTTSNIASTPQSTSVNTTSINTTRKIFQPETSDRISATPEGHLLRNIRIHSASERTPDHLPTSTLQEVQLHQTQVSDTVHSLPIRNLDQSMSHAPEVVHSTLTSSGRSVRISRISHRKPQTSSPILESVISTTSNNPPVSSTPVISELSEKLNATMILLAGGFLPSEPPSERRAA